jgi:hypothetical protein
MAINTYIISKKINLKLKIYLHIWIYFSLWFQGYLFVLSITNTCIIITVILYKLYQKNSKILQSLFFKQKINQ